jgi:murein DD-endopeptidase MepM/ murein hydrolase activator NlpD
VGAVRGVLVLVVLFGAPGAPVAAETGPWGWPLDGPREVVRDFDPPVTRYGAGHRGADLPSSPGAAVRAAAAGQVTYAGLLAGRGVVVVTHGSLRTTYEPVTAAAPVGAVVALGEVVGRLEPGHLGCAGAACLHWGLRRGEEYLDPVRLVERGPVRLLPVDGLAAPLREGAAVRGEAVPAGRVPEPPAGVADAAAPPVEVPPVEVDEPAWSLRAGETPLGVAAVVALALGIALLVRPRSRPPDPASGGLAAATAPPSDEPPGEPALLLDLDAARARRHAAS